MLIQQQTWLRQMDAILTPPAEGYGEESAWEAQWHLWAMVRWLACQSLDHQVFAQHVATWVMNMGSQMFACFLTPALPRTNNDLERFFRHAKGAYRRMTGRRNGNDYILRLGRYAVFHEEQEAQKQVLDHFRRVPYGQFRAERDAWRVSLAPGRQRQRFRRQPQVYLQA
jgi:hypothetical protein